MVGRLLVGFVCLNLQFSVSWLVDFQWGSCGSIFSFLCHGWQTFSGVRVAQSLVFCVMVGRLLVGFVWLNLQFSVSWQVDFQWGSCGSIFSFLCHGWQTFSGVRVAQSLLFCVMVGRLLVGFVWLNLQFSVSWQVDFQWGSCGLIFRFLCHVRQTFQWGSCGSLVFCVMVGRLLVGFVWLKLQFSVSWQVDFQWGSCGSIFSFLRHGWQTFSGVRVSQSLVFCVMVGDFQWGSCGSIFSFLSHGCRLLVGFVWLNLQFSVSWLVDFQWGSCGSIFSFLCHGWQTFSGVRVAQSLVFCVMVGRLLVGFVWLNLQFSAHGSHTFSGVRVSQSLVFCVMVGRLLVGFVWLKLQFSVSWQVDFQWGSCGSIFSFLRHGWQTFSGVREAQSLLFCLMVGRLLVGSCGSIFRFLCHDWWTFSGVRVAQSLVFCVMVGRLLVGFVCLNLQFSVSWLVDFQSMGFVWLNLQFSVSWLVEFQWGSCGSIFSFLCHGRQTFSGVGVAQSLVFCVMVGRLLMGFVKLNLQFSVSRLATFSGVRVAQYLVFCLMVGRLLVGFVWLNLQFSASWFAYFQWGSCVSIFSFLRHGWETFSGVRMAQTLVFCLMVGRLLVGFVWLNLQFQWGSASWVGGLLVIRFVFCVMAFNSFKLQFSVSWQVDFQWGSCVFCVMVGRLNLQFSVS